MQKALHLVEPVKGPWEVRERPIPKPGPGRVLIRVHSTALNPFDWKAKEYDWYTGSYPAILGFDAAGTIEEIGEDVDGWKVGDRVLFHGDYNADMATFQQFSLQPADVVAKLPDNIEFDDACTLPVALTTAAASFYAYKGSDSIPAFIPPWVEGGEQKYKGKPIVIFGGSTTVGQIALQLAKLSGFAPIITTASPRNAELVRSLGATHFIDRYSTDVTEQVESILSGSKVSLVLDAVSEKETQVMGLDVTSPGGVLVVILPSVIESAKAERQDKNVHFVYGAASGTNLRDFRRVMYAQLPRMLAEGKIKPLVPDVLPGGLHAIKDGLSQLQAMQVSAKKLVVHPWEV